MNVILGDKLPIGLQKGLFALPHDTSTPVICVGPGTGVAPMRAIIEERTYMGATGKVQNNLMSRCALLTTVMHSQLNNYGLHPYIRHTPEDNTLYFGCRSASKDQHYVSEWTRYAVEKSLTYRVAFSRDGPEGTPRVYVQDLVREDSKRIWELLGVRGGWVLISG